MIDETQELLDKAADKAMEEARREAREMARDPELAKLGRDELFSRAIRAQLQRHPRLGQAWKDAPGKAGGAA